jgi:hypothetical protein
MKIILKKNIVLYFWRMIQPVFLLSNLQYIQSDDDSWEGLAIFGYKLKYENNFLKTPSFIFGE